MVNRKMQIGKFWMDEGQHIIVLKLFSRAFDFLENVIIKVEAVANEDRFRHSIYNNIVNAYNYFIGKDKTYVSFPLKRIDSYFGEQYRT